MWRNNTICFDFNVHVVLESKSEKPVRKVAIVEPYSYHSQKRCIICYDECSISVYPNQKLLFYIFHLTRKKWDSTGSDVLHSKYNMIKYYVNF